MQPIGLLMKEHRLIERMVKVLEKELQQSKKSLKIDTEFMAVAVDFFKTYADETHHGKEEDILFNSLSKKNLSKNLKRIMDQLIQDHKTSRATIQALTEANKRYSQGYHASITEIMKKLRLLISLYPKHIETENKHFFFPVMDFFTKKECDVMLQEFINFDKNMIHEHYTSIVETQEKRYE